MTINTEELVVGGVYEIYCRNLVLGVWNGKDGFVGIRLKFEARFLDKEHPDTEDKRYAPYNTVRRVGDLVTTVPEDMELEEYLGSKCQRCGTQAWWTGPPAPAPWACKGGCWETMPVAVHNDKLFQFLDDVQANHEFPENHY